MEELASAGSTDSSLPWAWIRGQICEVMHWTFTEFDEQSAEVLQYFALRQAYHDMKEKVSAD